MAEYNSTIAAKQQDFSTGKNLPSNIGGRVRIATGSYTPDGTEAAGSVINLAKLPKDARVLPSSKLYFKAGQNAALTVKAGDTANDARYFASAAIGTSAITKALDGNAYDDTVLSEEGFVFLTTGGATLASGKLISFEIFYVLD